LDKYVERYTIIGLVVKLVFREQLSCHMHNKVTALGEIKKFLLKIWFLIMLS
jgi:hypothetical protein